MFYFQDGFFHVNGVSFRLPDGFYLDSCPEEHYKNSFPSTRRTHPFGGRSSSARIAWMQERSWNIFLSTTRA